MMTIQSLLKQATKQLATVSDSPQLDAELLLAHCLQKDRSYLYAWGEQQLDSVTQQRFAHCIEKRLTDYPIAYLLGCKEFWSLALIVTEAVLIPRPETELLVETALTAIEHIQSPTVIDLGTGSGAIALAIACERPDAHIIASDYSEAALTVARQNAKKNTIETVHFLQSDWFSHIPLESTVDLIVSNPPYIKADDVHLQQTIRHEPLQALVAGKTGLDDIHTILASASRYMKQGAHIIIEHGYDQGDTVPPLMQQAGFHNTQCLKDYNGNDRLSMGRKNDRFSSK